MDYRKGWRYRLAAALGLEDMARLYAHDRCVRCGLAFAGRERFTIFGRRARGLLALVFDDQVTAVLHPACFPLWVEENVPMRQPAEAAR